MELSLTDTPPAATAHADRWLTVEQIVQQPEWSSISRRAIYNAVARGELRCARPSAGRRRLLIRSSWISAWLETRTTPIEITRSRDR